MRKLFLIVSGKPTTIETMMELENHHLAITVVTSISGRNQYMLKSVGENWKRKRMFKQFQSVSPQTAY